MSTKQKTLYTKNSPVHPAHLSGQTIHALVRYSSSPNGLITAQNIIAAKLRNSRNLLTNYRQSRQRIDTAAGDYFLSVQHKLSQHIYQIDAVKNIQDLFLLEARAAVMYWRAIRVLCRQADTWHRIHPGGADPLNNLLNTGYTILARTCGEAIISAGLLPQLGILHGENVASPLVYDVAEIFRQSAVDSAILSLFSRKQKVTNRLPRSDMKRGYLRLYQQYDKRFLYCGRCETLRTIIYRETIQLKIAILEQRPWRPYAHPWRHGQMC
jgi:CRISPR-associated endonuclease Cas1